MLAQAVASAVTNLGFKTLLPRARPLPEHLPAFRFVHPQPTSSSMPSGHSASAVAFALGVGLVRPALGAALAPLAAGVAYSRVHTGAHWPSDVFFGSAIGAGAAMVHASGGPCGRRSPRSGVPPCKAPELPEGEGLAIVVNTLGGSYAEETAAALQKVFPKAYITEDGQDGDLAEEISRVATLPGVVALGVWGGDGTVGTAAATAVEHSLPLLVLPGGTLNHFARDAGTPSLTAAVAAASRGEAARADLAWWPWSAGCPGSPELLHLTMLNTASIGLYPNLVRRRELLQPALGKPARRRRGDVPDLRRRNTHHPDRRTGCGTNSGSCMSAADGTTPGTTPRWSGPSWTTASSTSGMITADESFARLRLLWSVLTGTVATSRITHLSEATSIRVESDGTPMVLAVDGEAMAGVRGVGIPRHARRGLTYYSPHPDGPRRHPSRTTLIQP